MTECFLPDRLSDVEKARQAGRQSLACPHLPSSNVDCGEETAG